MAVRKAERLHIVKSIENGLGQHQAESRDGTAHRKVLLPEGGRNDKGGIRHFESFHTA